MRRLAGLLLAAVLLPAGAGCSSSATSTPAWQQVWADDFNGPAGASINTGYWGYDTGQGKFGTGEIETMTSSRRNVHLDGRGDLDLVVIGHGAAGGPGAAWTSGRVETRANRPFGAPRGGEMMVTASIKQPGPGHTLGYWPGFWMVGRHGWPKDGEIDILEDVNGLSAESGTLHCGNLTQLNPDGTYGPCHEHDGIGSGLRPCRGCQTGFHSYTVIVDRRRPGNEQIRWYLDGRQFFSVREARVGRAVWAAGVDHGFSIILDVAVGGVYPDSQCRCTTPTSTTSSSLPMVVRYVRVYTR